MSKTKCFQLRFWKKTIILQTCSPGTTFLCQPTVHVLKSRCSSNLFTWNGTRRADFGKASVMSEVFLVISLRSCEVFKCSRDTTDFTDEALEEKIITSCLFLNSSFTISINVEIWTNFTISVHVCFLVFIANFYLWQQDSQWCFFICSILPLPSSAFVLYITANISKWLKLPKGAGKLWWMRHRGMQNNCMFWWVSKLSTTTHTSSHTCLFGHCKALLMTYSLLPAHPLQTLTLTLTVTLT